MNRGQLKEIKARWEDAKESLPDSVDDMYAMFNYDIPDLIAEVERLERIIREVKIDIPIGCETCEYTDNTFDSFPCRGCVDHDKWKWRIEG